MDNKTSYAVIGIVAALALFGIVVLTVAVTVVPLQQTEAAGCPFDTPALDASKGRCFR